MLTWAPAADDDEDDDGDEEAFSCGINTRQNPRDSRCTAAAAAVTGSPALYFQYQYLAGM